MAEGSALTIFCDYIVDKYGSMEVLSAEILADEFRSAFLDSMPVNPETLAAVAASLGITVTAGATPKGLRGYNDTYDGRVTIYYKDDDCESGQQNTILHEIREIMERCFVEIENGYAPLRTTALDKEANRFAGAVLLPYAEFRKKALEAGLDVVHLRDLYRKSCSQLIIRIAEVLHGDLFFYGARYERRDGYGSPHLVTCWAASTHDDHPVLPHRLFPRCGRPVVEGSAVDEAVKRRRPCFVDRIAISGDAADHDMTAIAQPIVRGGDVATVVMTVLLRQDRDIFEPQLERIKPVTIERFDCHL